MAEKEVQNESTSQLLKLTQGFMNNGHLVKEVYYNFDAINYFLFTECNQRISRLAGDIKNAISVFDDTSKLLYGWTAILAAPENKDLKLDFDSLSLIKGADLMHISFVGQRFLLLSGQA